MKSELQAVSIPGAMSRRSLLCSLGASALALTIKTSSSVAEAKIPADTEARETWPPAVAGVRMIDSKIALAATEMCRAASPPYLFHHAMRTFLFGSLIGRARGLRFDEELLYLASVMHDLGLTNQFAGDLPFEIQGAEVAKRFLREQEYSQERAEIVWDGIAMHCLAIGSYKRPEIALVGEGAGADVLGPDPAETKKQDTAAILQAFPRLKFKDSFLKTCADTVAEHPRAAGRTFMRDVAERYVTGFRPRNFCDQMAQAPYEE
jgi:HD domain